MPGSGIKLYLDSILKGYGFLTILPSGDLLNFGCSSNTHLPLTAFDKQFALGLDWEGVFFRFCLWKTISGACIN